ncbi:MAG: TonB C-terminal domain-containing protein [Sulfuricaulis sp.]
MTSLSIEFSPEIRQRTGLSRRVVLGALVVLFLVGIVAVVRAVMSDDSPRSRVVQTVSLLPLPPPPIEEKLPEPEIKEEVVIPEPQPMQQDDAAASADLGVDADGSGTGDGFGLIGKKGGRDLLEGGPFGWYGSLLGADIQDSLAERRRLRQVKYTAVLDLWIGKDGRIEKVELVRTSGNRDLDTTLRMAVAEVGKVREPPPPEMPQPVRLQVTSRL